MTVLAIGRLHGLNVSALYPRKLSDPVRGPSRSFDLGQTGPDFNVVALHPRADVRHRRQGHRLAPAATVALVLAVRHAHVVACLRRTQLISLFGGCGFVWAQILHSGVRCDY